MVRVSLVLSAGCLGIGVMALTLLLFGAVIQVEGERGRMMGGVDENAGMESGLEPDATRTFKAVNDTIAEDKSGKNVTESLVGNKLVDKMYDYIMHEYQSLRDNNSMEEERIDRKDSIVLGFDSREYNMFLKYSGTCLIQENVEQRLCLNMKHNGHIVVVGDLHGSLKDAYNIATVLENSSDDTIFVFLGDYVDRGANGPAVLALVLSLKCKYPRKVILLRGNHESARLNERHGFAIQARQISPETLDLAEKHVYNFLPQCAKINKIFFAHGGPPFGEFQPVNELFNVHLSYHHPHSTGLLWSDPRTDVEHNLLPSKRRAGFYYNSKALDSWCKEVGIVAVFRAHEVISNGFRKDFDETGECKNYTLFSSISRKGPGSYVIIHTNSTDTTPPAYDVIAMD